MGLEEAREHIKHLDEYYNNETSSIALIDAHLRIEALILEREKLELERLKFQVLKEIARTFEIKRFA